MTILHRGDRQRVGQTDPARFYRRLHTGLPLCGESARSSVAQWVMHDATLQALVYGILSPRSKVPKATLGVCVHPSLISPTPAIPASGPPFPHNYLILKRFTAARRAQTAPFTDPARDATLLAVVSLPYLVAAVVVDYNAEKQPDHEPPSKRQRQINVRLTRLD